MTHGHSVSDRTAGYRSPGDIFFFQAEDGIRDVAVTGVQTCALPISLCARNPALNRRLCQSRHGEQSRTRLNKDKLDRRFPAPASTPAIGAWKPLSKHDQIGRASCRERV